MMGWGGEKGGGYPLNPGSAVIGSVKDGILIYCTLAAASLQCACAVLMRKPEVSVVFTVFFPWWWWLQIWDIGGQPRFRSMWERYCRGVNAIVWVSCFGHDEWSLIHMQDKRYKKCTMLFRAKGWDIICFITCFLRYMVDAADWEKVEASRNELHNLLDKPQLQGIPVSD